MTTKSNDKTDKTNQHFFIVGMRKVIIICSYVLVVLLLLFGGLLIGGGCSYSSTAGPMNIDLSAIFSLFGLFITFVSVFLVRKLTRKNKTIFGTIMTLYAVGLFCFGRWVINDSKKHYDDLNTMADILPPNSGCLAIYYLTSFLAFMVGIILFVDKFDKKMCEFGKQ